MCIKSKVAISSVAIGQRDVQTVVNKASHSKIVLFQCITDVRRSVNKSPPVP